MLFLLFSLSTADAYVNDSIKLIKSAEGFVPHPYMDTTGNTTIGYGFLMTDGLPNKMTKKQADKYLNKILPYYIDIAKRFAGDQWNSLNLARKAVLIDFSYNLGHRVDLFVKMRQKLNMGDFEGTAYEMQNSLWCKQVKTRCTRNVRIMERGQL